MKRVKDVWKDINAACATYNAVSNSGEYSYVFSYESVYRVDYKLLKKLAKERKLKGQLKFDKTFGIWYDSVLWLSVCLNCVLFITVVILIGML